MTKVANNLWHSTPTPYKTRTAYPWPLRRIRFCTPMTYFTLPLKTYIYFAYRTSVMFPSIHAVFILDSLHDLSHSSWCLHLHQNNFLFLERFVPGGLDKSTLVSVCVCACVRVCTCVFAPMSWSESKCVAHPEVWQRCCLPFFFRAKSPLICSLQHTVHPALWPFLSVSALLRNIVCSPT